MDRDTYNSVVEAIYDAAIDTQQWTPAIDALRSSLNSIAAGFFIETSDHKLIDHYMIGLDPREMGVYGEHYAKNNPWFTVPGLMKPGHVLTDLSLEKLHNDKDAYFQTEMCQEWSLRQDFRHLMGGNLTDLQGNKINFSFFRSTYDGYYSDREVKTYHSLCRHLTKAVELNFRMENLQMTTDTNEAALNALSLGVVVLGKTGKIEYVNTYGKKILQAGNALFEHRANIKAYEEQSGKALRSAIDAGYKTLKSSTISIKRLEQSALSVSVVPSREQRSFFGFNQYRLILFITDPDDHDNGDADYLTKKWSLSPTEAIFTCHLLRGLSVNQTADVMKLTRETARWYSKQIMRKLDDNSQNSLIIKLMNDLSSVIKPA